VSATPACPPTDGFAHISALLGFDDPDWCAPRRAAVLPALKTASRLQPAQLRTMLRTQHGKLTIRNDGNAVSLAREYRDALSSLREEARRHGRLVPLGQAWAASNQLITMLTPHQPPVVRHVLAGLVAGEILCRVLDDVADRRVLSAREEELLRRAWRAAHPLPAYFQRPRASGSATTRLGAR
jgi:hypothetical protein